MLDIYKIKHFRHNFLDITTNDRIDTLEGVLLPEAKES